MIGDGHVLLLHSQRFDLQLFTNLGDLIRGYKGEQNNVLEAYRKALESEQQAAVLAPDVAEYQKQLAKIRQQLDELIEKVKLTEAGKSGR